MNNLGVIPRIAFPKLPECRIHTHHCLQVSVLHSLKKDINYHVGGLIDQFSKTLGKTKQLIKYLCPVSNMKRQNDEI